MSCSKLITQLYKGVQRRQNTPKSLVSPWVSVFIFAGIVFVFRLSQVLFFLWFRANMILTKFYKDAVQCRDNLRTNLSKLPLGRPTWPDHRYSRQNSQQLDCELPGTLHSCFCFCVRNRRSFVSGCRGLTCEQSRPSLQLHLHLTEGSCSCTESDTFCGSTRRLGTIFCKSFI